MKSAPILGLLIILSCLSNVFSQSRYIDGFIISNTYDTVYGLVDYFYNNKDQQTCMFLKDGVIIEYTPSQILGYGFEGDKFFTSQVMEDNFIEVIVDGVLSLYKYNSRYYLQKEGDEVYVLDKIDTLIEIGSKKYIRQGHKWKGILIYQVADCKKVKSKAEQTRYAESNLKRLVKEYNACKGYEYTIHKKPKRLNKIEYGGYVGLTQSILDNSIRSDRFSYMDNIYYSVYPSGGIILALFSSNPHMHFSFQSGINFNYNVLTSLIEIEHENSAAYHDSYIGFSTISVPLLLRYSLPVRENYLFFYSGNGFSHNFNRYTNRVSDIVENKTVRIYESEAFEMFKNSFGYFGGAGFRKPFKAFNLCIAVNYDVTPLARSVFLKAALHRISVSLVIIKK